MSANLLASELAQLSSESRRKHPDLRIAAEKSSQELKSISVTSEQQLAADLSRRPAFVEPFIIACKTRNAKLASSGVNSLQRLVISKGLSKSRLQDALEALNACTDLGLEIQLKILQALPSLLQNYAEDLKGDLFSAALQVCSALQNTKVQTVSGVASATLQQLITSAFEKVGDEDRHVSQTSTTFEIPSDEQTLQLRPAAYDAFRVFRDLVMVAENRDTKFVQFSSLSRESALELLWSCIKANPELISSHDELGSVVRANILPLLTQAVSEKLSFSITVRSFRILDLIFSRHLRQFSEECEVVFGLAIPALEIDAAPSWKRSLIMELLRNFFSESTRVIDAYELFDASENGKTVVQDIMTAFVRMSSEKPTIIGLGHQSTVPVGPLSSREQAAQDLSIEAAGIAAGVMSSTIGVTEVNVAGVSTQWSLPRLPCLETLDKVESLAIPETYVYTLVLECLTGISDGLAKFILPLTIQPGRVGTKVADSSGDDPLSRRRAGSIQTSQGQHKMTTLPDAVRLADQGTAKRVEVAASLIESCWPAVLATASTFLNAALDDQFYRNLIKAYQRFVQVAGLLRLSTARDALITTLGKAAVPPHVLNTLHAEPPRTPIPESPGVFSNSKTLLSVESLISPTTVDRERRSVSETARPMLTTRNLLCLRALLNLAIALGPTLETAFTVVVDTLKQADTVLSSTSPQQMVRQALTPSQKQTEPPAVVQAFSNEVAAVEAAATRLLESTADYSDAAFVNVLKTFSRMLPSKHPVTALLHDTEDSPTIGTSRMGTRNFSGLSLANTAAESQLRDCKFAIPRIGHLASLNVSRFTSSNPSESGWSMLVDDMISLASDGRGYKEMRRGATDVLCNIAAEVIFEVSDEDVETRAMVQRRALAVLLRTIDAIYAEEGELTACDIEVQGHVVESLKMIVERCGESLVAGWNRTVAILSSVFEREGMSPERQDDEKAHIDWEHISNDLISLSLGKTAFAAVQLIASDFLAAIPMDVMPALIELFHRFTGQLEDLNISLTTITMTWNLADFLFNTFSADELHQTSVHVQEADDTIQEIERGSRNSPSTLWLLSLLRMQEIIQSGQPEVRKAALQTLCSIFRNHGDEFTAATWNVTLRRIVLRIAANDVATYLQDDNDDQDDTKSTTNGEAISIAIIRGISDIFAQHLHQIEQVPQLPSLWEHLLGRLEAYLDVQKYSLVTAVYQAISRVITQVRTDSRIWSSPMFRTLHLWLKRNPATTQISSHGDSEEAFIAYVEAGTEIYRLTHRSLGVPQSRALVENLYLTVNQSQGPLHGADANMLSPLQAKVMTFLRAVQTEAPSTLVIVAAKLITLHEDTAEERPADTRPTFVAVANQAIGWLQELIVENIQNEELHEGVAILTAVQSLRQCVEQKYLFKIAHKGVPLWRKATLSALVLSNPILRLCQENRLEKTLESCLWKEYARIARGIVLAPGLDSVERTPKIFEDEKADVESFKQLENALVPQLGAPNLQDETREIFVHALFQASIIHSTEDLAVFNIVSPLENINRIRRGRVVRAKCAQREEMCYECLSELVSLSSRGDSSVEHKTLARYAAPLLVLRLAIPIKAYIADQPLRGHKPQPLSELEELLKCLEIIGELQCEPDAFAVAHNGTDRWVKEQAHLHWLYPLLIKAVATTGNSPTGQEVLRPLQTVLEKIACYAG